MNMSRRRSRLSPRQNLSQRQNLSPESIETETNPMRSIMDRSERPKIDLMETKTMKFYKLLELKKENIDFSQFEAEYESYVNEIKETNSDEIKRKILTKEKTEKFRDYYYYEHIRVEAADKKKNIDEAIKLRANVLIRIYSYPDGLQPESKIEFKEKCNKNTMKDCEPSSGFKSVRKGFSRRFRFGGQRSTKKNRTKKRQNKKQNSKSKNKEEQRRTKK